MFVGSVDGHCVVANLDIGELEHSLLVFLGRVFEETHSFRLAFLGLQQFHLVHFHSRQFVKQLLHFLFTAAFRQVAHFHFEHHSLLPLHFHILLVGFHSILQILLIFINQIIQKDIIFYISLYYKIFRYSNITLLCIITYFFIICTLNFINLYTRIQNHRIFYQINYNIIRKVNGN